MGIRRPIIIPVGVANNSLATASNDPTINHPTGNAPIDNHPTLQPLQWQASQPTQPTLQPLQRHASQPTQPELPSTNWTAAEEQAIHEVIMKIRGAEDATKGPYSRDIKFWGMVSDELDYRQDQLKTLVRPKDRARTGTACKNYWSRRGRKLTNYDERRGKQRSTELITSAQKKKEVKQTKK